MSNYLLGFPNKKERDDFFIAIVVILLFVWLFWYMLMGRENPNLNNVVPPVATVVEEPDSDNDGVLDIDDRCPNLAGVSVNNGCPADSDNDGIYDVDDSCPNLAGTSDNRGCPSDLDGDGIYDEDDDCPNEKGKSTNKGCPELTAEDMSFLDDLRESVQFDSGSDVLKLESRRDLDRLAEILNVKSKINLRIEGHTDSTGRNHQDLSQRRANSCKSYLLMKGVHGSRLQAIGFGMSKPLPNMLGSDARNRRVIFQPN